MRSFWSRHKKAPDASNDSPATTADTALHEQQPGKWIDDLIEASRTDQPRWRYRELDAYEVGRRLLQSSREEQRDAVMSAVQWLLEHSDFWRYNVLNDMDMYQPVLVIRRAMLVLLKRNLPFEHDDVLAIIDFFDRHDPIHTRGEPQVLRVVSNYEKKNGLSEDIREHLKCYLNRSASPTDPGYPTDADTRRKIKQLEKFAGISTERLPLVEGEAWSDAALAEMERLSADAPEVRRAWGELLELCAEASGAKPSAKWLRQAQPLLDAIGRRDFTQTVLRWFALVDRPRTQPIETWSEYLPNPNLMIDDRNADVLKALVWLCAEEGITGEGVAGEDGAEAARSLRALALSAYRKVPQVGPRCVRVGNACVWALGNMPGTTGLGQLALLKVRVKFGTAQKGIEKALDAVAEREGVPREEVEEMSVPAYGLQEVGARSEKLGEYTATLVVTGTKSTELRWTKPDGTPQKSVPKAVRENHADELRKLKSAATDIQKMLPAQRDRIENLYLQQKTWDYPTWRERYLDHPLIGTLARRLVWTFTRGERNAAGVFYDGRIVGRNGRVLDWIEDDGRGSEGGGKNNLDVLDNEKGTAQETRVQLWHPISESTEEVLAWRDWLAELEIQQPFKQAHREVYLLTDAERNTATYSNRFAAHFVKQHQFNALCAVQGWHAPLRLMVDDALPPPTRQMPAYGLRAEFWVEGMGEEYGEDTTEAGTYLYLATDQVRFFPIEAQKNYAHAFGGAYTPERYGEGAPVEALALEGVPPLVFSEIMRDCDLFVGVSSIGNDPNWTDSGPEGRYLDYWSNYSFGHLAETAKTRKSVLEKLVPRLKIADRCRLTEKFLEVQGTYHTYKIHLGSSNILMEPNDQYLCIVSSPKEAFARRAGQVFLPFEGDATMSLILSKALLLAEDHKIEDPSILSQINRHAAS